jgi:H+-translocating NAD(P) transhydrogenase subunit alpha
MSGRRLYISTTLLLAGVLYVAAHAQPPEFDPDLIKPPEIDFGEAGKTEKDLTAEQPDFVPPERADETSSSAKSNLVVHLALFVLAFYLGHEIMGKASPSLHAPLLTRLCVISGITLIAAVVVAGKNFPILSIALSTLAVGLTTASVVGGFFLTHRLLTATRGK